ncbi:MAG: hypothetical protein NT076_02850 [Candidatus Pacearchaeota archaeon]|nr:hypothetical protein [Candidatus Pacearchaeota archaeon]
MELNCSQCGARLSIEEVEKAKDTCPICKKETSWITDPEGFISD